MPGVHFSYRTCGTSNSFQAGHVLGMKATIENYLKGIKQSIEASYVQRKNTQEICPMDQV